MFKNRWLSHQREHLPVAAAVLIGIIGGLSARILEWAVGLFSLWTRTTRPGQGALATTLATILWPALGGLAVSFLGQLVYKNRHPEEVGEVIEGVALHRGDLPAGRLIYRGYSSVLTIGTGGSAGPEGPVILIGSGLGSWLSRRLHVSPELAATLVAGGAAAGIAAAFNAPLAGVFFALEVILGELSVQSFGLVVIASVTSSAVVQQFLGAGPLVEAPLYSLHSGVELVIYVLVGLGAALAALLFVQAMDWSSGVFGRLGIPSRLKPALGGLLVGVMTLALPQVRGVGWPFLGELARPGVHLAAWLLIVLAAAKILATALTLSSGGAGGTLAPLLLVGAYVGGALGAYLHQIDPQVVTTPAAYALAGAGATLAAATRAPLTSIILIFELTRNYRLMLPFMLSAVVAVMAAGALSRKTIYNLSFLRRGIELRWGKDVGILREILVAEAMNRDVVTVTKFSAIRDVIALMQRTNHTGFPVVDEQGQLCGMITLVDVRRLPLEGRLDREVGDAMASGVVVADLEENLAEASQKMAARGLGRLPVVDRQHPGRVVGILTRSDILDAYNRVLGIGMPGVPRTGK